MKILAVGDYERAPYHPFTGVDQLLKNLLEPEHEVTCTGDYDAFLMNSIKKYDMVISYIDAFEFSYSLEQLIGLLQFVASGGKMLVLHGGVSLAQKVEAAQMIGSHFVGHPDRAMLEYSKTKEHPITEGMEVFTLFEEPYQMDFCYGTECEHFLQYEYEGKFFTAGWTTTYGSGQVVYLQPGHEVAIYEDKEVQRLVKNTVHFLEK